MKYDLLVIGAGPGGYTAAIKAAKSGLKTALVEKEALGGTCLNWGCIPTKTYYKNAEFLRELAHGEDLGVTLGSYSFSLEKARERKEEVVGRLVKGIAHLIATHKIDYYTGQASFLDSRRVQVEAVGSSEILEATHVIIATGSRTNVPPIEGIRHPEVLDSRGILELTQVPESLLIIGGGVIGMEFAGIFAGFGTQVQVVEYMEEILLHEDREVVKRLMPLLKKQGIKTALSTKVRAIEKTEAGFLIRAENKKGEEVVYEATHVLNAAGRIPNVEGLELEKTGLIMEKWGIPVNGYSQTAVPHIYAIGDVNGKTLLAHAAAHQGIRAITHILEPSSNEPEPLVPSCTFTFPEIASIGMTEEKAREMGIPYKTNKFLFAANGKALAIGEKEGFVKVVTDENHKLLGVHILGPHASDLIHEGALALSKGMGVADISHVIHAHPTLAEAFDEAVLGVAGLAIHQV